MSNEKHRKRACCKIAFGKNSSNIRERCRIQSAALLVCAYRESGNVDVILEKQLYSAEKVQNKTSPGGTLSAKCGTYFISRPYAVIFSDTRVWRRPCSRFIHSFFRSKAMASRNSSDRILARPRVRNLRKPKSFFNRAKAPST